MFSSRCRCLSWCNRCHFRDARLLTLRWARFGRYSDWCRFHACVSLSFLKQPNRPPEPPARGAGGSGGRPCIWTKSGKIRKNGKNEKWWHFMTSDCYKNMKNEKSFFWKLKIDFLKIEKSMFWNLKFWNFWFFWKSVFKPWDLSRKIRNLNREQIR